MIVPVQVSQKQLNSPYILPDLFEVNFTSKCSKNIVTYLIENVADISNLKTSLTATTSAMDNLLPWRSFAIHPIKIAVYQR